MIFKRIEDQKIPYEASYDTVKPVVYKLTNQATSVGPNQASITKLGKKKIMITTNQPGAVKMYITRGKATINGKKYNKVLNVRYNTSRTIPFTTDSFTNW